MIERKKARRAHGEGALNQRSDGRWELKFTLPDGTRKSVYGRTAKEAREKRQEFERNPVAGGASASAARQLSLADWLERWLESKQREVVTSTSRSYALHIRTHIAPHRVGKMPLAKISYAALDQLISDLSKKGVSPRTIRITKTILNQGLRHALRQRLITENPVNDLIFPRMTTTEIVPPPLADLHTLMEKLPKDRTYTNVTHFALLTGARQGEILALTWADIDFKKKTLPILRSIEESGRRTSFKEPKTKNSRRHLSISPEIEAILTSQRQVVDLLRTIHAGSWTEHDLVFPSKTGHAINASNLVNWLHRQQDLAGIRRFRFHDLRHANATYLLHQGVPITSVSRNLGHGQVSTTLNIYAHSIAEAHREVATQAGSLFFPKGVNPKQEDTPGH